jgi:hypothetical protein
MILQNVPVGTKKSFTGAFPRVQKKDYCIFITVIIIIFNVVFAWKYIKIIYFFKKLFLILKHENNLKIIK